MSRIRRNHLSLSAWEKHRFIQAILELKRRGVYDRIVAEHIEVNSTDYLDKDGGQRVAHVSPGLLPWHRQYVLRFEDELRRIEPDVTVPYWDFTADQDLGSPLWDEEFMGGNGRVGDRQVMTGPFARRNGWIVNVSVVPVGGASTVLNGRCTADDRDFLVRDIGSSTPRPPDARELADAMALPTYDCPPWNHTSGLAPPYRSFRNHLEGYASFPWQPKGPKLHGKCHLWIGGHMAYLASPNDPMFFLLHCFIDKIWSDWQHMHPDQPHYLPETGVHDVPDLRTPLEPWFTMTPADLLDHTRFYTYDR